MKEVTKPWIAFKVLAAGAIPPQDGFRYAFANGAGFYPGRDVRLRACPGRADRHGNPGRCWTAPAAMARMSGQPVRCKVWLRVQMGGRSRRGPRRRAVGCSWSVTAGRWARCRRRRTRPCCHPTVRRWLWWSSEIRSLLWVVSCLADPTYMGYQNSVNHHRPVGFPAGPVVVCVKPRSPSRVRPVRLP